MCIPCMFRNLPPDYSEDMLENYDITEQAIELFKLYFDVFRYTSLRRVIECGKEGIKGQYYNESSYEQMTLTTACRYKLRYVDYDDEWEFSTLWKTFIQTYDPQTPSAVSLFA